MANKLLNLLAITSLAILACSSGAEPVNALSLSSPHAVRDGLRGHDALAKRKRSVNGSSNLVRRCKPRPTPVPTDSATSSSADSTSADSSTLAPAPSSSSAPAPAPSSSSDNSNPGSTSQAPAPSNTPTPPPSGDSGKLCLAWPNGNQDLDKYKVSTIYSWSETGPSDASSLGVNFVPQLWGWKNADAFGKVVVNGYANTALFINEPNEAGQANMSPQDAVGLWNQYMEPLRAQGYRLGSAATSSNPNGLTWMQNFFSACNGGCQPDFMAVHWYDVSTQNFKDYVNLWHTTFGKNIWVTEFAFQNFNGGAQGSLGDIQGFMGDVTSWMDQQSFVEKYCWFGAMHDMTNVNPLNSLMQADGSPTPLGNQYLSS